MRTNLRAVCAGASGYASKRRGTDKIGSHPSVMGGGAPMTPKSQKGSRAFANSDLLPGEKGDYGLTAREQEILRLLAEGLLKKEIADALSISVNTVSTHLRVYDKLHVNTNTGAAVKALRKELSSSPFQRNLRGSQQSYDSSSKPVQAERSRRYLKG